MRALIKICLMVFLTACTTTVRSKLEPSAQTTSVPGDADDCAIWIHPLKNDLSIVIGNDKTANGGLYTWDLSGKQISFLPFKRSINLDVRYGMNIGGRPWDILVTGERETGLLHVFTIDPVRRSLFEISEPAGISSGFNGNLYGFCLYHNPHTHQFYAFVSQHASQSEIHQILLEDNGQGRVRGKLVRSFGGKEHRSQIEGMCADDELGYLYCAAEQEAIIKFYADPEHGDALLHRFAIDDGIRGDREGLALYACPEGEGYLLLSSQGNSTLKVYDRSGDNIFIATIEKNGSTATDGVAATSCPAGPFSHGFVVCHNDKARNFVLYDWNNLASDQLLKCSCEQP